jgi:hypothetical protein
MPPDLALARDHTRGMLEAIQPRLCGNAGDARGLSRGEVPPRRLALGPERRVLTHLPTLGGKVIVVYEAQL